MATTLPVIDYEHIKKAKDAPLEEFYTSGHRTCQGCESALVMRDFAKASGPRTIATGATGCMYVANTSYQTTPWIIPWMHTQLGAGGSSAVGMAAGLRALMRKGRSPRRRSTSSTSAAISAGPTWACRGFPARCRPTTTS